jgi:hypothetical protein
MKTQTIGLIHTWLDTPLAMEMLFGFAATTFVALCLLRYLKMHPHRDE